MNNLERSTFALRLRTLRKKAKLTQADVAEALNLHRTAYTKYETDKACPDQVCLLTLAELFRVSVDYLLGKEEEALSPSLEDNSVTVALSPEEQELIITFRQLSESQRRLLLQTEHALYDASHNEN